jgi:hypothetical protein
MRRSFAQRSMPRSDQRAICTAPRAFGRPCPRHDPARSAAQIARSSPTQLKCTAVAAGFRPRLGPHRCAMAPSAPNSPTLRLRSTSCVPTSDRSLVKRHQRRYYPAVTFDRDKMKRAAAELAVKGVFIGTSSWKYPLCRARHNSYFAVHRIMPSALG